MQSLARFTSPLLKGTRPLHAGQLLCLQAQLRISLINTGSYSTGAAEALPEVDGAELIKLLDAKTPGLLLLDVRSPEVSTTNVRACNTNIAHAADRGSVGMPALIRTRFWGLVLGRGQGEGVCGQEGSPSPAPLPHNQQTTMYVLTSADMSNY